MAQQPILSCLKRPNGNNMVFESAGAVRIQVSGDQIALLLRQTPGMGSHLNIWNWKRGADRHVSALLDAMYIVALWLSLADTVL